MNLESEVIYISVILTLYMWLFMNVNILIQNQ